jgi:phosphotransferase system HPr (HPr) family protein
MILRKTLQIVDPMGLHLRAAARLVGIASKYQSRICVSIGDRTSDAKSLLGLLTLAVACGMMITLTIDGTDALDALVDLQQMIENGIGVIFR